MSSSNHTQLNVQPRTLNGSSSSRRLRKEGTVPATVYGSGSEPVSVQVDARHLRQTLAKGGAIVDLIIGDSAAQPAIVKELQRHPVRGEITHIDIQRVDLTQPVSSTVGLELTHLEEAAGVRKGGIVENPVREVTVEALPDSIPDVITFSIETLEIGESLTLAAVPMPEGVKLLDNPEAVFVSLAAPRIAKEQDEVSEESDTAADSSDAS